MVPSPDSPLVDAISPFSLWFGPSSDCTSYTDQRGVRRPQDGDGRPFVIDDRELPPDVQVEGCDIGAVEADAFVAPPAGPVAGTPGFTG